MKLTDIAALMRRHSGWALFEAMQERVIAAGASTAEHYRRHLEGEDQGFPRMMDSLLYYQRWVDEHPGQDAPAEVCHIRTDSQHAGWVAQGCPTLDREVFYCSTCKMHFTAPKPVSGFALG